jgi:hypothetical protein
LGKVSQATVFLNMDVLGVVNLGFQPAGANATATADPSTADPNAGGFDPNAVGGGNGTATADPNASGFDPNAVDGGNGAATADPNAGGFDPNAVGGGNEAATADPNADASVSPSAAASVDPSAAGLGSKRRRNIALADMLPASKRASNALNGCISLTGSINITGGMNGALPPLINKALVFPIFNTSEVLFHVSPRSFWFVQSVLYSLMWL